VLLPNREIRTSYQELRLVGGCKLGVVLSLFTRADRKIWRHHSSLLAAKAIVSQT